MRKLEDVGAVRQGVGEDTGGWRRHRRLKKTQTVGEDTDGCRVILVLLYTNTLRPHTLVA